MQGFWIADSVAVATQEMSFGLESKIRNLKSHTNWKNDSYKCSDYRIFNWYKILTSSFPSSPHSQPLSISLNMGSINNRYLLM